MLLCLLLFVCATMKSCEFKKKKKKNYSIYKIKSGEINSRDQKNYFTYLFLLS